MDERSLAFVVKIWQDRAAAGEPPGWHGRVDDVDGQSGMTFNSLLALSVYLGEHSGMAGSKEAPRGPDDQRRWLAGWLPAALDVRPGRGGPDAGES